MRVLKIISLLLLMGNSLLQGDYIYLKNGRRIVGTVIEERADAVVFEMPMGTITYDRAKIDRIEYNEASSQERKTEQPTLQFDQEIKDLKRAVSGLISQKTTTKLLMNKSRNAESDLRRLEEDLLKARQDLVTVRKELEPYAQYHGKRVPSGIYRAYMAVVTRRDSLLAEIQSFEGQIKLLNDEKHSITSKMMEAEQTFMGKLTELRGRYDQLIEAGCPPDALDSVDRILSSQSGNMDRQVIPLKRVGNSYIVSVRLNDSITEDFILDTGCSGIFLNADLVSRLRLSTKHSLGRSYAEIANGDKVEVILLNLQKVQIGSFAVTNVPASVEANPGTQQHLLLLGMSYLKHFHFSIDTSEGNLILERIGD